MAQLEDFSTEITAGNYGLDVLNYGKTSGGLYVPLKVDDDGNLNIKGEVTQTGSIVSSEILIERQIIKSNINSDDLYPPSGAKGVVAEFVIYGITGTFESGEGASLRVGIRNYNNNYNVIFYETGRSAKSFDTPFITIYPGIAEEISDNEIQKRLNTLITGQRIRFYLNVSGTFGEGEGVDGELRVSWIL